MLRFKPVSVLVAVTCAAAITAPLWSFTVPLICAVLCARTNDAASNSTHSVFFIHRPPIPWAWYCGGVGLSIRCDKLIRQAPAPPETAIRDSSLAHREGPLARVPFLVSIRQV